MEFRWVVFIALWTMLVGPVLDMPFGAPQAQPNRAAPKAANRDR